MSDLFKTKGYSRMIARFIIWLRSNGRAWLSYLYFLRFSLMLWLILLLLIVLDVLNISTFVTRVLLTMSDGWQAMYAASAIVLLGWSAMLFARLVIIYGEVRFDIQPPPLLRLKPGTMGFRVLVWCQIPGAFLLFYILCLSLCDSPSGPGASRLLNIVTLARIGIVCGMLGGVVFATIIWFVISWTYYLLHAQSSGGQQIWEFTLPYSPHGNHSISNMVRNVMDAAKVQESPTGDGTSGAGLFTRLLGKGYSSADGNSLGSGHSLAAAVVFGLLILYFLVGYISFPLPGQDRDLASVHGLISGMRWLLSWSDFTHRWLERHLGGLCSGFLAFLVAAVLLMTYLKVRTAKPDRGTAYLATSVAFGFIWVLIARAPHYPAIATIVVLLILLGSVLGGLAFFLDRLRVPAAMLLAFALFGYKRMLPTDHVYSPVSAAVKPDVERLSPKLLAKQFLEERAKVAHSNDPIVIITATGGGIHAAYWTGTVLDGLEAAFAMKDKDSPLEEKILLMSSASGGSMAVANWIENHAEFGDAPSSLQRQPLREAAKQPALEAVAWGLLHTDLWRVFYPFGKFNHDRAWFLEQANLAGLYLANHPPPAGQSPERQEIDQHWNTIKSLAELKPQFDPLADGKVAHIPAFTLNATVVETGERFLLANYAPSQFKMKGDVPLATLPWHSALSFFPQYPGKDLKISTAARLSANFPYVSPVARADVDGLCSGKDGRPESRCGTFHLADGGYYDNDGVASATEFLWLAFGEDAAPHDPSAPKKRVLLIQIRDTPLPIETSGSLPNYEASLSKKRKPSQLTAPVKTVYGSWHVSETMRNQRELSALQAALPGIDLRTVAFSFPGKRVKCCWLTTSPGNTTLNWRLTRGDQDQIRSQWETQNACAIALAAWADAPPSDEQKSPAHDVVEKCAVMPAER